MKQKQKAGGKKQNGKISKASRTIRKFGTLWWESELKKKKIPVKIMIIDGLKMDSNILTLFLIIWLCNLI